VSRKSLSLRGTAWPARDAAAGPVDWCRPRRGLGAIHRRRPLGGAEFALRRRDLL